MNLLLLGLPGCGKGTLSASLEEKKRMQHLSTGDLFRNNIANKTSLGIKAMEFMDKGKYVPDEITIDMVKEYLKSKNLFDNLIYDGFPRTIFQAQEFDKFLKENNAKLDKILYIDIDKKLAIKRISGRIICPKCQAIYNTISLKPKLQGICDNDNEKLIVRKDDLPENVKVRLDVYENQTKPLIDYYGDRIIRFDIKNNLINDFEEKLFEAIGI